MDKSRQLNTHRYVIALCTALLVIFRFTFLALRMKLVATYVMVSPIGISTGVMPAIFAVIDDYFSPKVTGTAAGIIMFIGDLGSIIAPLVIGYLATLTGTLASAFRFSAIMATATAITSLLLKRQSK